MTKINIISEFDIEDCEKQYMINLHGGLFEPENTQYFGYKNYDIENHYGWWEGRCKRFSLATVKMLRLYY
jgi:hypothetical protein